MENTVVPNAKTRCEKPYKTNGNEDFWSQKSKKGSKMIKKHYLEKVFGTRFKNVNKPYKPNGKQSFSKCKNALRKTL